LITHLTNEEVKQRYMKCSMMTLRGACILVPMYLSIYLRTMTDLFTKVKSEGNQ